MADGRLFTEYRRSTLLVPKLGSERWAQWEQHRNLQQNGTIYMNSDRGQTVMRAASYGCVDTMVPELTKRVARWDGAVELLSQPAGIGSGRSYLPGRTELVAGDPDILAATTFPEMIGTFPTRVATYTAIPQMVPRVAVAAPAPMNRYSASYGAQQMR